MTLSPSGIEFSIYRTFSLHDCLSVLFMHDKEFILFRSNTLKLLKLVLDSILCQNCNCMSRENALTETGATNYHAQYRFPDRGCAIKG